MLGRTLCDLGGVSGVFLKFTRRYRVQTRYCCLSQLYDREILAEHGNMWFVLNFVVVVAGNFVLYPSEARASPSYLSAFIKNKF